LRTIAALALLVATLLGTATSVAAARQAQTSVFIWTYENGQVVYDACYVLVDSSDVACDENGNGYVFFPQVPVGTYTVRQVADLGPNRYVEDFTIEVTGIGDPSAPYPGMEMFSTEIVSTPGASGGSGASGTVAGAEPAGTMEPIALLPAIADVPAGLVETGRRTRSLPEVAGNYTDPAETTRLFTQWGWQGNAVASFALPEGQEAQSGQVNGVYVSIHQFSSPDAARAALDFSLTEQAAGTVLQEVPVSPLGEHTRALYGPEDYGNEITILVQQGSFFIRVSAAMLDGDPTADAVAVTEAILKNVTAPQSTTIDQEASAASSGGDTTTGSQAIVPIESEGSDPSSAASPQQTSNVVISTVISGYPFHDACYVLVGYSDEACAEAPDYVVRFYDVPLGTYTVRQTADLGPGQWVEDFTIQVTGSGDWEGFEANVNMADSSSSTLAGQAFNVTIMTSEGG
jgi:hypothetical protein